MAAAANTEIEATCESCVFFVPHGEQGFCRRFPPVLMYVAVQAPPVGGIATPNQAPQIGFNAQPAMVPVARRAWCGEYDGGDEAYYNSMSNESGTGGEQKSN